MIDAKRRHKDEINYVDYSNKTDNFGKNKTYYVRTYGLRSSWSDYDIDDWSQYEKVEDVNRTPKKFWNEPEMVDKSILK